MKRKQTIKRGPRSLCNSYWGYAVALLIATITLTAGLGRAADDPLRQILLDALTDIQNQIHGWDRAGSLELTTTITVGVIGLITAGLQAIRSGMARIITAVLGILSGALVIVNQNYFDADHRAYRSLAMQSHQLVRDFIMQLG